MCEARLDSGWNPNRHKSYKDLSYPVIIERVFNVHDLHMQIVKEQREFEKFWHAPELQNRKGKLTVMQGHGSGVRKYDGVQDGY